MLELCDGADLLIHDAQYTEEEFVELSDWGHSTPAFAVQVATGPASKRLDMFHHDPGHTDRQIDTMLRAARHVAQADRQGRGERGQGGRNHRAEEAVSVDQAPERTTRCRRSTPPDSRTPWAGSPPG